MRKYLSQSMIILGLALCCLFLGYYIGFCQGEGVSLFSAFAQEVPKEEKIIYNRSIAIVNLDEGILVNEEQENYGTQMINTVTDDIVVTGLEDARRGIEMGTYSAYIIIPAAFSEDVAAVSARPIKPELTFALGSGLTGTEREDVIYRVEAICQQFGDNLSKVYLSSILDEYHGTQDDAASIIENDTEDMELLLSIEGEDLVESIEIPMVTIVEYQISDLDVSDNYAAAQQGVENIDQAYKTYFETGKQELVGFLDFFEETAEQMKTWEEELDSMNKAIQGMAEKASFDPDEKPDYAEQKDAVMGFLQNGADKGTVEAKLNELIQVVKADNVFGSDGTNRKEAWEAIALQMQALQESYKEMRDSYEENSASIRNFDISTYMDESEISGYLSDIEKNLYQVETDVNNLVAEYEKLIADVYEATQNDIQAFEESIREGQERSEQKLFTGLEAAKDSRQLNNETNLYLLNTIINRLPYTRIGELENREVYDFIAAPVKTVNQSEIPKEQDGKDSIGGWIITVIILLLLVTAVASQIVISSIRRKEEIYDVEIGL